MADEQVSRRTFLAVAGIAGAASFVPDAVRRGADLAGRHAESDGDLRSGAPVKLGIASYSLRNFSRDQALAMMKELHTPYANFKSVHLPYELAADKLSAVRREIEAAGFQIVGGGTITFGSDTDDDVASGSAVEYGVRHYFEYAKAAGMPLVVATCDPAILPRVERFAKQFDVKVAIHNHGPEDPHFPSPYDVLNRVKGMDPRMGLCMDIGHATRAGADIVKAAADAGSRLLDIHAKDLRQRNDKDSQCIVGEGVLPIPELFRQLQRMGYAGYVNLEYEIDPTDPLPGMKQSFAYMRGVLAGARAT